jgi:hypothetical protein
MPRSPSTYVLPPGTTPQVPNSVIGSAMFNAAMDDIAQTFNTVLPVPYGGTGGASAIAGYDALNTRGTDIPTAASIDLGAANGPNLHLTGTTTITSVTLGSGKVRFVIADAAFQLTASASLVVNGSTSANYTTSAGELLFFIGDTAGLVRVWSLTGDEYVPPIASAADWRTGTSTTKLLGVKNTWDAAAYVSLGNSLSGNITLDLATGFNFSGTATGNITFNSVSNAKNQSGTIDITASGGNRTVSYNSSSFGTYNAVSLGTINSGTTVQFTYTRASNGKLILSRGGTI